MMKITIKNILNLKINMIISTYISGYEVKYNKAITLIIM